MSTNIKTQETTSQLKKEELPKISEMKLPQEEETDGAENTMDVMKEDTDGEGEYTEQPQDTNYLKQVENALKEAR